MRGTTKLDVWHYQTYCVTLPNLMHGTTKLMCDNTKTPKLADVGNEARLLDAIESYKMVNLSQLVVIRLRVKLII